MGRGFARSISVKHLTSAALILLIALCATLTWVALSGFSVDASRWKYRLEQVLADQTGRKVSIEGPVQLSLSLRPRLAIGDLRVANPPDQESGEFARMGHAELALEIWPLLTERRLHVLSLVGSDLKLSLRQLADGRNNWTLTPRNRVAPADSLSANAVNPADPVNPVNPGAVSSIHPDIDLLRIERVAIDYQNAQARAHFFDLDELEASARYQQPLEVRLKGRVEKNFPYEFALKGGHLADLQRERADFPIEATLVFVGSTLSLNGKIWRDGAGTSGQMSLGLGSPDLQQIERLLQIELPKVGATALAGDLSFKPGSLALGPLIGTIGETRIDGQLQLQLPTKIGDRPRLTGHLSLPTLDMRPFLKEPGQTRAASTQSLSQWYADISQAEFSLQQLYGVDADLELSVARWLSLPGDVRDVSLKLQLAKGRLQAPVSALVEGVQLKGELSADASAVPASFDLALETRDSPLGGLGRLLFGLKTVQGTLGSFHLRVAAQGKQVSDLVNSMEVQLAIARADLTYGKKPVGFRLEWLTLAVPTAGSLSANTTGTLLGQPIEANIIAGSLQNLMRGLVPVQLLASSRSVRASLKGSVDEHGEASGIELTLDAAKASDAARWLNLQPRSDTSLHVSGQARWSPSQWVVKNGLLRIGKTEVRGAANHAGSLRAKIDIDTLDPKDIESLLPQSAAQPGKQGATANTADTGRFTLDIPVLPSGIDISDTDLEVSIKKIADSPLQLASIQFQAQVRKGQMLASPFSVSVLGTPFAGAVALDLRSTDPGGEVWINANEVDAGRMLGGLKLVDGMAAHIGALRVHAVLKGSRLGDVLANSEITGEIERGAVTLRDANTGAQTQIRIENGELRSERDAPLRLNLKGALGEYPIALRLQTGRLSELLATDQRVPFAIDADSLDNKITVTGSLARTLADRDVDLALSLTGRDLQTLSGLARTALPRWGPYALNGRLKVSRKGYEVNGLNLTIASSRLSGRGSLDTQQKPPRIDIDLAASNIQIDDFPIDLWTATDGAHKPVEQPGAVAAESSFDADALRARAAAASDQAQRLLSPQILGRQDVHLNVNVDQVLSGKDRLGNGRLRARIERGRADVGPVEVNIPGGSARWWLGYQPNGQTVAIDTRLSIDRFDYGIIARRARPNANVRGRVSLELDVKAQAPALSQAMQYGNGKLDFVVWPESLQSGLFDLWAANLLFALAEKADPSQSSKINCGIGRFTLTDGILRDRQLLLDTTRVRIAGSGQADFKDEQLSLYFRPQPKLAQFFSLATPIAVGGSFTKPEVGAAPGAILETIARLGTSLIWVPIQKLFGNEVPADGADVCGVAAN